MSFKAKTFQQAEDRYGKIVEGKWADESTWCEVYPLPEVVRQVLTNSATGKFCTRIYVNKDMFLPLDKAFQNVIARGKLCELKTFDGCYQIRKVRGDNEKLSTHSYALAIDLNASENPLGGPVAFSEEFVKCFTDAGFDWGGEFKRKDGMHFSLAWEGKSV